MTESEFVILLSKSIDTFISVSPIISMQTVTDLVRAPNTVGGLAPNTTAMILDENGKGK